MRLIATIAFAVACLFFAYSGVQTFLAQQQQQQNLLQSATKVH